MHDRNSSWCYAIPGRNGAINGRTIDLFCNRFWGSSHRATNQRNTIIEMNVLCTYMYTVHCTQRIEEYLFIFIYSFIFDPQLIKNLTAKNANIYRFIYTNPKCESKLICFFPSQYIYSLCMCINLFLFLCQPFYLDSC